MATTPFDGDTSCFEAPLVMHKVSEIQTVCSAEVFPQRTLNDIEDVPNENPDIALRTLPVVGICLSSDAAKTLVFGMKVAGDSNGTEVSNANVTTSALAPAPSGMRGALEINWESDDQRDTEADDPLSINLDAKLQLNAPNFEPIMVMCREEDVGVHEGLLTMAAPVAKMLGAQLVF